MFTILLTCVGGELAPELINQFKDSKKHSVRVIGVDQNDQALGRYFCDVFYTVPHGSDDGYNKDIEKIAISNNVDLVIPTSDEEAASLSNANVFFDNNKCTLACVDKDTLAILADKKLTFEYLKKHGVHTPKTLIAQNYDELASATDSLFDQLGEFVVKPANARGGRGVYVVSSKYTEVKSFDDRREVHSDIRSFNNILKHNLKDDFPLIVMQRLLEPVIDIDLLGWNGEEVKVVPRRRVNSAVPNDGHIFVSDKNLVELGEKLINIFNLSWLYDCDVMFDSQGNPCVLELNPRQSGSVSVSVAAGVPLLDDLISLAKGEREQINEARVPEGIKVLPYKSLGLVKI